jgi:hypothetical protein
MVNKGLFFAALIALITCSVQVVDCDSNTEGDYRKGKRPMAGTPKIEVQEVDQVNIIASQYLVAQKKWRPDQFRLEHRGFSPDGHAIIVWAIYLEDEIRPVPGGGNSVELYVDRTAQRVVRELGFQ